LLALVCFSVALNVFLLSPGGKAEFLSALGAEMKDRAVVGFTILNMLFGTILAPKTIGERWIARRD
jgi:hypothetical protein